MVLGSNSSDAHPVRWMRFVRENGVQGEDPEIWKVRDEVCLDIALDLVNISLCFITDPNLGWHDQSA